MVNRARWGKPDPCPKQSQAGCKCKHACKLLEPLIRSVAANKTSVKLAFSASGGGAIWCAGREKEPRETYNGGNPPRFS
ncbi:hypothetical protein B296_00032447 [Ensete ventricosum]|uniref:Uncharacterized protein n=1 Tax=Ensete ventricosum TaxID=4639 RepID=A0A426Z3T9_ENSVE|nr:hypothetical protein B296_00032447 [Ensete ventricosum]